MTPEYAHSTTETARQGVGLHRLLSSIVTGLDEDCGGRQAIEAGAMRRTRTSESQKRPKHPVEVAATSMAHLDQATHRRVRDS